MRKLTRPKLTKLHVKGPPTGRDVTIRLDDLTFEHCNMVSWSMDGLGMPPFPTRRTTSVCFLTEVGTRIEVVGERVEFRWKER